jgi:hypothetical protein
MFAPLEPGLLCRATVRIAKELRAIQSGSANIPASFWQGWRAALVACIAPFCPGGASVTVDLAKAQLAATE